MNPIDFPEKNLVLTKPPSMTDEECSPLVVHDTGEAFVSCWQPSEEERRAVAAGAPFWLWIIGRAHPPVSLQVESPFLPAEAPPDAPAPSPLAESVRAELSSERGAAEARAEELDDHA